MVEVEFINKTKNNVKKWEKLANEIFNLSADILKIKHNINVGLTFLDSNDAKHINNVYRNKDYIPDVLSFPINLSKKEIKSIGFEELGDIFVCLEEAKRKMTMYNHTIKEEVAFLLVHGFLHLLGFDHEISEKEEHKMFKLQDKILNQLGINYEIKFTEQDYLKAGL